MRYRPPLKWPRNRGRQGDAGSGEDALEHLEGGVGSVDRLTGDPTGGRRQLPGVLQDGQVGVAEDHCRHGAVRGRPQGPGDLVAVRGALVEALDAVNGDTVLSKEFQRNRRVVTNDVDDEVGAVYPRLPGQAREPTEGVEVEARRFVDDAAEATDGLRHRW
jgi:hypothetical protein